MSARDNRIKDAITAMQVRGARAMLSWSQDQLTAASGVPKRTLAGFEGGETDPRASTLAAIRTALESAGVEFIAENGGGPGVRLRARIS
jgi:predicted transcriptional regulator